MQLVLVNQAAHGGPGVFYLDGVEAVLHARSLAQQPAECFETVLVLLIVGRGYHAQDGLGQSGGELLLPHQCMLYHPYGFIGTEQRMPLFEAVDELVEPGRGPHPVRGCIIVQGIAVVTVESLDAYQLVTVLEAYGNGYDGSDVVTVLCASYRPFIPCPSGRGRMEDPAVELRPWEQAAIEVDPPFSGERGK